MKGRRGQERKRERESRRGPGLLVAVWVWVAGGVPGFPGSYLEPEALSARGAYLADLETGAELFAKNPDLRLFPASTTKIMTALLAAEKGSLEEVVTVSPRAAAVGEASLWLEAEEKIKLEDLIAAALMKSANDACVALAEHLAGSEEAFVALMNQRLQELGATRTHFVNPHGLHDPDHYSTPRDLVTIARAALQNPVVRRFCSLRERIIPWPGHPGPRHVRNLNRLLWRYPGADGIKTGRTREAGPCLVFSATRRNWQLVGAVLKAPRRWTDSEKLLEYGFTHFERRRVILAGQTIRTVAVREGRLPFLSAVADREIVVVLRRGQRTPRGTVFLPRELQAPLAPGTVLGQISVPGYHCRGRARLITPEGVEQVWWAALRDWGGGLRGSRGEGLGLVLLLAGGVLYGALAKSYRFCRDRLAPRRRRFRSRGPSLR